MDEMDMEDRVRHGDWFYLTLNSMNFRGRYLDHEELYSVIEVQIKQIRRYKKWLLFGPVIEKEVWNKILDPNEDRNSIAVRPKFESYPSYIAIIDMKSVIDKNTNLKIN
jgi:hypothetical protein